MNPKDLISCVPVVSAIIERQIDGVRQVYVQTRWKPDRDKEYSGTLEVPAGWIEKYENVYDALRREVLEETGLTVRTIKPTMLDKTYSRGKDEAFAFVPFCCQQQTKGGLPWVGFVFICEVENGEPIAQEEETKDPRWMTKEELRQRLAASGDEVFTLQRGALELYCSE